MQDTVPDTSSIQDVTSILVEQRNAAFNQVADLAVQLRGIQRRVVELEAQLRAAKSSQDDKTQTSSD
jgi:hypothetical protein